MVMSQKLGLSSCFPTYGAYENIKTPMKTYDFSSGLILVIWPHGAWRAILSSQEFVDGSGQLSSVQNPC